MPCSLAASWPLGAVGPLMQRPVYLFLCLKFPASLVCHLALLLLSALLAAPSAILFLHPSVCLPAFACYQHPRLPGTQAYVPACISLDGHYPPTSSCMRTTIMPQSPRPILPAAATSASPSSSTNAAPATSTSTKHDANLLDPASGAVAPDLSPGTAAAQQARARGRRTVTLVACFECQKKKTKVYIH